jgi:glycosyltransferase involved in cell wall biosynthesis
MMTHRVLHVLPDLGRGGGQAVVLQLVAQADRRRFELHVAWLDGPDDLAPAFERAGASTIPLHHGDDGSLAAAFELARHIRQRAIDVVHVHSDRDRKVGHLAALLTGTPVVGHLHSPWPHLGPMHGLGAGALGRRWSELKALVRRGVEQHVVQHYLAASEEVGAFHVGLVGAPIAIVRNGIDAEAARPISREARGQLRTEVDVPADVPLLICVGRLADGKGQDELVAVLAELPGVHLLLVGDGPERQRIEDLAHDLGVGDRVAILGDRDDVTALCRAADLFVFASRSEGLPLAVLEAMACELAVVAYDIPGLRAIITDGVEGRLVPVGLRRDLTYAIAELLADRPTRTAMGAAARATIAARYDARVMTRGAEAVYDLVLGNDPLEARRRRARRLVAC